MSNLRLGVVMDPIERIKPGKDSTFAMMLEASRRGAEIHYMEQSDMRLLAGVASATTTTATSGARCCSSTSAWCATSTRTR